MGDASDFTFCQVGQKVEDDHMDSPKTIPNIGNITLDESHSNAVSSTKVDSSVQDVSLVDDARSKEPGASSSIKQLEAGGMRVSANGAVDLKPVNKKPAVRAKVPFEKGYSQLDWLKITRTHPDLAGLKGQSNRRLISLDEVKQHKTEGSIWTVLKGRVYNISPYMKFHPGGADMLMKAAGKDCTSLFNKYHAWVNAEFLLEKCLVGISDDSH